MSFVDKLKAKSREIDNKLQIDKYGLEPDLPVTVAEVEEKEDDPLFNVHKRSLPVGDDKIVIWNVTKEEFEDIKKDRHDMDLVKELEGQCKTYVDGDSVIIYYDLIPAQATAEERSVYYNPKLLVLDKIDAPVEQIPIVEFIG